MKIQLFSVLMAALFISACNSSSDSEPELNTKTAGPADLIFVGEHIITMDTLTANVEAVAVHGEEISALGSRDEILKLKGENTRVIELGNHALLPGFIDTHGHVTFTARLLDFVNLSSPPVGPVEDIEDLIELLKDRVSKANPGEWVFGYGYDDSLLAENRHPTRDDLDLASNEHPIALMHVSGHLAAVNSAALAAKGMGETTEDPPGGVIRRREDSNEPNGVLEETAIYPFIFSQFQNVDPQRLETLIRDSVQLYASYGITTIQDGAASLEDVELMRAAAERSAFVTDIVAYPIGNQLDDEALETIDVQSSYKGGFRVGGIKFSLDGSPQGRTAFLSKPYLQGPPGAAPEYRAYPTYSAEQFNPRIARLLRQGTPVMTHANGDAAIDMLIDGVSEAVDGIDMPDHRTVIIHAQLTREDQLHKFKELGLVPSYYAAHPFFWGDWHRLSFGEERAAFISPLGRTAELDIPFTVHNDSPVVPPDIMRLLWVSVNRETRSGFVLGPEQRATPLQALHAVTLGAAYQYFEEDQKGSITSGKRADFVILGDNPLTVDPATIKDIPVIETFARGESVFRQQ